MKTTSSPNVGFRHGITARLLGLAIIALIAIAGLLGPSKARAATYTISSGTTSTSGVAQMTASYNLNYPPGQLFRINAGFYDPSGVTHYDVYCVVSGKTANGGWTVIAEFPLNNTSNGVGYYINFKTGTYYVGYKIRAAARLVGQTSSSAIVGIAEAAAYAEGYEPPPVD